MQNKVTDGKTLVVTAGGTMIPSGAAYPVCGKVGIAVTDIPASKSGVVSIERGVYSFPISALASSASQGASVYLASGVTVGTAASDFTLTSASGATEIGKLAESAASGATTITVLIN